MKSHFRSQIIFFFTLIALVGAPLLSHSGWTATPNAALAERLAKEHLGDKPSRDYKKDRLGLQPRLLRASDAKESETSNQIERVLLGWEDTLRSSNLNAIKDFVIHRGILGRPYTAEELFDKTETSAALNATVLIQIEALERALENAQELLRKASKDTQANLRAQIKGITKLRDKKAKEYATLSTTLGKLFAVHTDMLVRGLFIKNNGKLSTDPHLTAEQAKAAPTVERADFKLKGMNLGYFLNQTGILGNEARLKLIENDVSLIADVKRFDALGAESLQTLLEKNLNTSPEQIQQLASALKVKHFSEPDREETDIKKLKAKLLKVSNDIESNGEITSPLLATSHIVNARVMSELARMVRPEDSWIDVREIYGPITSSLIPAIGGRILSDSELTDNIWSQARRFGMKIGNLISARKVVDFTRKSLGVAGNHPIYEKFLGSVALENKLSRWATAVVKVARDRRVDEATRVKNILQQMETESNSGELKAYEYLEFLARLTAAEDVWDLIRRNVLERDPELYKARKNSVATTSVFDAVAELDTKRRQGQLVWISGMANNNAAFSNATMATLFTGAAYTAIHFGWFDSFLKFMPF